MASHHFGIDRADASRMIRHDFRDFRARGLQRIRQIGPARSLRGNRTFFPASDALKFAGQRRSKKFLRHVVDLKIPRQPRRWPSPDPPPRSGNFASWPGATPSLRQRPAKNRTAFALVNRIQSNDAKERIARSSSAVSAGSEKLTAGSSSTVAPIFSRRVLQVARLLDGARDHDAFSVERSRRAHARVPRLSRVQQSGGAALPQLSARPAAPIASASSGGPESFSHNALRCRPGESTATSSTSFPFSTRPHAPIETWQPPSKTGERGAFRGHSRCAFPRHSSCASTRKFRRPPREPRFRSRPAPPRAD